MKKTKNAVLILSVLLALLQCGRNARQVEKITENGVEVLVNQALPSKVKGEASHLSLDKQFTIDFENEGLAKIGIKDVAGLDVDSKGNIYVWEYISKEHFIFKFAGNGNYLSSLGRSGQGPGELESVVDFRIDERDRVIIGDAQRRKLVVLDTVGSFINEVPVIRPVDFWATLLDNDNILAVKFVPVNEEGMSQQPIMLWSAKVEPLAVLHPGKKYPNWLRAKSINGIQTVPPSFPPWAMSKRFIYIGNPDAGYEILAYDFDGKLRRKIRKNYSPVPVPPDLKERAMKRFDQGPWKALKVKDKVYFPDHMPPFQYFFVDEEGRLFIMTCEKGQRDSEYKYDIFNQDGIFIATTAMANYQPELQSPLEVKAKNHCIYCLRMKESGYQESEGLLISHIHGN